MKKRVAYLLPSLKKPGGWRSHAIAFLNAVCAYVEPVIFVAEAEFEEARQLFPKWVIMRLPVIQSASFSGPRGAAALLRSYLAVQRLDDLKVSLVHSLEAYPTGLVGRWLAGRIRCPHVITTHGTYGVIWSRLPLDRAFYRGVLVKAERICPVSHGTADMMRRYFGDVLDERRLRPILNGNDFYRRISSQEALARRLPEERMILTVGDIKPRKGQHISLRAFARLSRGIPDLHYFLVGSFVENAYYRELREIIETERLENVRLLGEVTDERLDELYRQASVFVLAPQQVDLQFEGFGLVFLEAGAYALPVVATDSGGVADAVKDGETGFLVPSGDVEGMASAVRRLLTDEALNRRMGGANRRWAETLTWERCGRAYDAIYREIWGQT